jgi:hypothetical protein
MSHDPHDLELAILADISIPAGYTVDRTNLEPLVLQNSLDGSIFTTGGQLGLKDNTKGAIPNDLALGVLHVSGLAC